MFLVLAISRSNEIDLAIICSMHQIKVKEATDDETKSKGRLVRVSQGTII